MELLLVICNHSFKLVQFLHRQNNGKEKKSFTFHEKLSNIQNEVTVSFDY